jgi:hypothetical protein
LTQCQRGTGSELLGLLRYIEGEPSGATLLTLSEADRVEPEQDNHVGPLAEFGAMRTEILARQLTQQNLLTLQLTISGAIFGFALTEPSRNLFLLIVPFSSYALSGRYSRQHVFIKAIGIFINEVLSGKIPGGLHWEDWTFTNSRTPRLPRFIDPLYLTFPGAALLALTIVAPSVFRGYAQDLWGQLGLTALWLVGAVVTVLTLAMTRVIVQGVRQNPRRGQP